MDQPYALAGRQIDPVAGLVHWAGQSQHIRRKPLEILALLAQAGTGLVSRETFIDVVWDGNALVGERALNDTVSALRQLLEDKDRHQPLLRTIPRRGYQLAVPVVWEPAVASPSFVPGAGLPALPNHRLIRLLARSGHYDTWLAETNDRGNRLALRICRSETQLRWLKREVTMLRLLRERLGGRPDLVAIDAWQLDDPPYTLSMRHCAGGDLASWVQERGGWSAIPVALRLRLLAQIAEALGATHQAGLAHGAIQPSAILIDRDANGKEFACLGGWARGNVADRASLVAASITVTGLTANTADAPRAEDDLRAFAELALRICCGQLDGGLPDAAALADAHPDWQELWNDCRTPDGLPPSATTVASRLRELAAAAERSDLSSATATPQRATPPAVAPAVPLPRDPIPTPERTPDRPPVPSGTDEFAPYNVLGNLGEGGMGVVYLAEQPAPLRRKVALKVLRESVPDPQLLARFHAERRTLALMQHPHIAAVYDIGQSATGRPYFVMEYVPGLDIEQYCTQHRLPLADRITLFLQACAGVLHAHQRGVIHRDLKPGNLLVCAQQGQKGAVKIIDFGVAKLLQGPLGSELFQTRIGTTVGTPLYCSPEQLDPAAGDIDTRADIYSLGVVLYQLLVGATPLDRRTISDLTARQLADQLRQRTVPNPAQRFDGLPADLQRDHSAGCGMTPTTLRGILQSDLAWVIGRCLEQDPEDRYASVLDLQRDLERWLAQQPVEARPVTPMYRVRKFYRRHRLQVWSSLAILLLLIATTVSAIIGFVQARQATRTAEQAAAQARLAATFQTAQIRGLDLPGMGLDIRTTL